MEIPEIKQWFFARRNGNTADILKRGGSPFKMIFGCDVPSISELGRRIGFDRELALTLWNDSNVRESRLLAPWLMDPEEFTRQECIDMASDSRCMEDAMMLAFKLLKRRDDAQEILRALPEGSHAAKALRQHLE